MDTCCPLLLNADFQHILQLGLWFWTGHSIMSCFTLISNFPCCFATCYFHRLGALSALLIVQLVPNTGMCSLCLWSGLAAVGSRCILSLTSFLSSSRFMPQPCFSCLLVSLWIVNQQGPVDLLSFLPPFLPHPSVQLRRSTARLEARTTSCMKDTCFLHLERAYRALWYVFLIFSMVPWYNR